jgi:hypothetical protein
MIGWAFLNAFLTFITFITLLLGGASLITGSIKRDRSLIVFGLKALLIAILAFMASCIFLWPHLKALGVGLINILKSFK